MIGLTSYQLAAINNPYEHFAFLAGIAVGKTYTGSHFAIKMIEEHPTSTGLIGANTYDQLSQATLRELLLWLDTYGYEYVVDQRPPAHWNVRRAFKKYNNIISIKPKTKPGMVTIFTRVMGSSNPLRGIQFSWYWIDETRDTPRDTHDVILSRMRESKTFRKGLITSTTNGDDWACERFAKARPGQRLYGSMHVPTIRSVEAGIISQAFYDSLRASYSPMMALQELDAQHVNVLGGRAYYAANEKNKSPIAPWGDAVPNRDRPLIVGCDFNFQPAPCIWMIGQMGPDEPDGYGGFWSEHIHWFGEIYEDQEPNTRMLTRRVINMYPDFFYRVFGDASGGKGTTSNAGEHDYAQMSQEFAESGCQFTIDYDQANPRVKDRIENMNSKLYNSMGEIYQTYSSQSCPNFDADMRIVGWKKTIAKGTGKLDDGGDNKRTHASDGGGYAVFKLMPPRRTGHIVESIPSAILQDINAQF